MKPEDEDNSNPFKCFIDTLDMSGMDEDAGIDGDHVCEICENCNVCHQCRRNDLENILGKVISDNELSPEDQEMVKSLSLDASIFTQGVFPVLFSFFKFLMSEYPDISEIKVLNQFHITIKGVGKVVISTSSPSAKVDDD